MQASLALGGGSRLGRIHRNQARRGVTANGATRGAIDTPFNRARRGGERGSVKMTSKNDKQDKTNLNVAHAVGNALGRMHANVRAVCGAAASQVVGTGAVMVDFKDEGEENTNGASSLQKYDGLVCAGLVATALSELNGNHVFMAAFWSWATAQLMKYFTAFYREGRWDWRVMFDSGGMPSSHTSLVVGLTTAIAYAYGLSSSLFPLSLAFSLIVMYDAAGVRRHAGKQAEVLNRILGELVKGEATEKKLKEVLGHSPLQVFAGACLGVGMAIVYMHRYSGGYASLA